MKDTSPCGTVEIWSEVTGKLVKHEGSAGSGQVSGQRGCAPLPALALKPRDAERGPQVNTRIARLQPIRSRTGSLPSQTQDPRHGLVLTPGLKYFPVCDSRDMSDDFYSKADATLHEMQISYFSRKNK